MEKIVVLDGGVVNPGDLSWDPIAAIGDLQVYDRTPADQTVSRIGDARLILTNKTVIDRAVLDACPQLRYVGVLGTGYNTVDVKAAREKGVAVTNIPAYSTASVAQMTIALLLELAVRTGDHSVQVHEGRWTACPDYCFWSYPLVELAGKTMGIVGYGSIGRAVAKIAAALGMRVLGYSRSAALGSRDGEAEIVPLERLLAESDVVTLHCPLTEQTRELINRETLAGMKDGAYLINTSRGGVIQEEAVAEALRSGKLAGAGLDVLSTEPPKADNPMLTAPNCIVTPHIAWAPAAARSRLLGIAEANLRAFLEGKALNRVE